MSTSFAEDFIKEWEQFADYSNDPNKTDGQVIEQEAISDEKVLDLLKAIYDLKPEYFSHPPNKPNRRRP